ncbi:MAG: hypothetical protein SXQ77_03485, partial [Halobacteria archaeon]|nr:hypothetical protein [Halobacteria archaeon]
RLPVYAFTFGNLILVLVLPLETIELAALEGGLLAMISLTSLPHTNKYAKKPKEYESVGIDVLHVLVTSAVLTVFVGLVLLVQTYTDSNPWIASAVLVGCFALVSYAIHRYELVAIGNVVRDVSPAAESNSKSKEDGDVRQ